MNRILVVLPYCQKDILLAEKLLSWIHELNSISAEQSILLVADGQIPKERARDVQRLAQTTFGHVTTVLVRVDEETEKDWGSASKVMFEQAANQVEQNYKLPFLWLEPDCVPLKETWLVKLEHAYANAPRKFMGYVVTADQMTQGSPHMAGPGIYPNNTFTLLKDYLKNGKYFDIACAPFILPRATHTALIHHFWGKPSLSPVFKRYRSKDDPENVLTPSVISKDAVLWHRCKDGSLIDVLREKVQKTPVTEEEVTIPAE